MKILECYPHKGTYQPGEIIQIIVQVLGEFGLEGDLLLEVFYLDKQISTTSKKVVSHSDVKEYSFEFNVPENSPRGYGVEARLLHACGEEMDNASTSFDVLGAWTERPRYGFLTDFGADRVEMFTSVDSLVRYHINGLQFYDWQYRHDCLLPPTDVYVDPLGRALSKKNIMDSIEIAHQRGIAAMAYLAIYAASLEFWEKHQDWGLYDGEGKPFTFENFLGIMDPSPYSPWIDHLLDECDRTLANTSFNGLHIDQYGEPKEGFNFKGNKVDIPASFNYFIWLSKKRYPQSIVTFNAVGNWPIEQLANTPIDFLYIEVWATTPHYKDLLHIVQGGRKLSSGKPVVVALYIPADRMVNILLADAIIMASGGSRIELGEVERLLSDPYFPNYQAIPAELKGRLRKYYDFLVRYGDFFGPDSEDVAEYQVDAPEGVWVITRKRAEWLVISLINFSGIDDVRWDEKHSSPTQVAEFTITVKGVGTVNKIMCASPDDTNLSLHELNWQSELENVQIRIDKLEYWTLIALQVIEGSI